MHVHIPNINRITTDAFTQYFTQKICTVHLLAETHIIYQNHFRINFIISSTLTNDKRLMERQLKGHDTLMTAPKISSPIWKPQKVKREKKWHTFIGGGFRFPQRQDRRLRNIFLFFSRETLSPPLTFTLNVFRWVKLCPSPPLPPLNFFLPSLQSSFDCCNHYFRFRA